MIDDIRTIMWKEWKELGRGSRTSRFFPFIILLIFGAYILPNILLAGIEDWGIAMVILIWLPFLFSASIIADSVAGEKERHTLETLLASRLPDRAIVLGKMFTTVLYAWGLTLVGMALAAVVANLKSTSGTLVMYPLDFFIGMIVLTFLAALFISALGVIISLRARAAREAQQIIALSSMAIPFGSLLILPFIPSYVLSFIVSGGIDRILFVIVAIFLVLSLLLTTIALNQFKRTKLMANIG